MVTKFLKFSPDIKVIFKFSTLPSVIKIKSLNEMTHEYCAQVELQFRPKLASSTHKSFKISVKEWECYPRFPSDFLISALNFRTKMH